MTTGLFFSVISNQLFFDLSLTHHLTISTPSYCAPFPIQKDAHIAVYSPPLLLILGISKPTTSFWPNDLVHQLPNYQVYKHYASNTIAALDKLLRRDYPQYDEQHR